MQFAVTYAPAVFDTRTLMMGRQSAGLGFLRAALAARPERIWCHATTMAQARTFGEDVRALAPEPPELRFIAWDDPGKLAHAGLLYRGDPGIAGDAWMRRRHARARAYSLCGITHTLSSQNAMTALANLVTAPLYPWDAVICTSTAARDVVRAIVEVQAEHLRERVGATRVPLPQFPLIPLGVHPGDFAQSPAARAEARTALGLEPDDVAVLFAGRLAFHGKAHPLPMLLALEAVARAEGRRVHLLLFGRFPGEAVEKAYLDDARRFAPSVRTLHLDGTSDTNRDRAWAGADVFCSLSDNVQETFGLTPVEAMAAGLPVVVSDWDGYKDTVRDGIDGFRVRTTAAPPGAGTDLVDRFDLNMDHYDGFIGNVAACTAVDVSAATDAFRRLVADPALRRRMGEAGRRRVAERFDWTVVFGQYRALWDDLAERRRADPRCPDEDARTTRPDRPDPFALFRSFPTAPLSQATRLALRPGVTRAEAVGRRGLLSLSYADPVMPSPEAIGRLYDAAAARGSLTVAELAAAADMRAATDFFRAVAWLAKVGILTFS
ncbi:glycosyltransferase [Lichenibacterium minor]|uniref:Glycosyltransferase n=1 Tax=Lichenibacterium minor TaxID=2316528 RepID=A0A4Q2U0Q8_9HYPH|nr:glycosyltransferase family 4 protein [Lichenibacterium minor]RYC30009.1 glycosyltransferase [Lichenibacterium minor]